MTRSRETPYERRERLNLEQAIALSAANSVSSAQTSPASARLSSSNQLKQLTGQPTAMILQPPVKVITPSSTILDSSRSSTRPKSPPNRPSTSDPIAIVTLSPAATIPLGSNNRSSPINIFSKPPNESRAPGWSTSKFQQEYSSTSDPTQQIDLALHPNINITDSSSPSNPKEKVSISPTIPIERSNSSGNLSKPKRPRPRPVSQAAIEEARDRLRLEYDPESSRNLGSSASAAVQDDVEKSHDPTTRHQDLSNIPPTLVIPGTSQPSDSSSPDKMSVNLPQSDKSHSPRLPLAKLSAVSSKTSPTRVHDSNQDNTQPQRTDPLASNSEIVQNGSRPVASNKRGRPRKKTTKLPPESNRNKTHDNTAASHSEDNSRSNHAAEHTEPQMFENVRPGKRIRKQSAIGQASVKSLDALLNLSQPDNKNQSRSKKVEKSDKPSDIPDKARRRDIGKTASTRQTKNKPSDMVSAKPSGRTKRVDDSDDDDIVVISGPEATSCPSLSEQHFVPASPKPVPQLPSSPLSSPALLSEDELSLQPARVSTKRSKSGPDRKGRKKSSRGDEKNPAVSVDPLACQGPVRSRDRNTATEKKEQPVASVVVGRIELDQSTTGQKDCVATEAPEKRRSPRKGENQPRLIDESCSASVLKADSPVSGSSTERPLPLQATKVDSTRASSPLKPLPSNTDHSIKSKTHETKSGSKPQKSLAEIIKSLETSSTGKPIKKRPIMIGLAREDRFRLHMKINERPVVQKQVVNKKKVKKRRGEYDSGEDSDPDQKKKKKTDDDESGEEEEEDKVTEDPAEEDEVVEYD